MSLALRCTMLAGALLCLCGIAQPAAAALKVCNRTSYVLYAASGVASQTEIASQGWSRIAPGDCQMVLSSDLTAAGYFVYARSSQAHSGQARGWGGSRAICVKDVNFTSRDPIAARDCQSDNFFELPFAAIDTQHMRSWTTTLSEAPTIATLPQARAAGVKRLLRDLGYKIASTDGSPDKAADAALKDFRKRLRLSPTATDADLFDALETEALKIAAPAGYSICNDTTKPVAAAIAEKLAASWISHGWWKIAAGSCAKAITTSLAAESIYLFVQRIGGPALVTGPAKFCVADIEFDIQGRARCKDRGLTEVGFAETRVKGVAGYAAHVGETGLLRPAQRHSTTSK